MNEAIVAGLQPLVGLSLWAIGRAGTLEWFEFGGPEQATDLHGETRGVGAYALHVDCAWRLLGPDGMIWSSGQRTRTSKSIGGCCSRRVTPGISWSGPQASNREPCGLTSACSCRARSQRGSVRANAPMAG